MLNAEYKKYKTRIEHWVWQQEELFQQNRGDESWNGVGWGENEKRR